jgi:hypothetical protein
MLTVENDTCLPPIANTSQLEKNCMATNASVRDRAITILKDEPTI